MYMRAYRAVVISGFVAVAGAGAVVGHGLSPAPVKPEPKTVRHIGDVTEVLSGSMPVDRHTMRVVTARGNLTGQRELAWVADTGQPVGDARCTQNFKIGPGGKPRVRPTMLICWRTSADRSVYTVLVDIEHPPSKQASVQAIDEAWTRLG
jgi:hypothetical protein